MFCNRVFEDVNYMPVERQRFRDIRIEIRDLVGKRITFIDSKSPANVVLILDAFFNANMCVYKHVIIVLIFPCRLWIHLYATISIRQVTVVAITA